MTRQLRSAVTGRIAIEAAAAILLFILPLLFLPAARAEEGMEIWRHTALNAGSVTQICTAGADHSQAYAIVRGGGIRRSADGGQTWSRANQGLPAGPLGNTPVLALAASPDDAQLCFASITLQAGEAAIYRTSDGAKSWQPVMRVATSSNSHALAVTRQAGIVYAAIGSRLYLGVQSGVTWAEQGGWAQGSPALALAVHPADETRLYVATADSILTSRDSGRTWASLPPAASDWHPRALALAGGGALYVSSGSAGHSTLYSTTDDGESWLLLNGLKTEAGIDALIWDPADTRVGYAAAGGGIVKTIDAGRTWAGLRLGLEAGDVYALAQGSRGALLAGTRSGIWRVNPSVPTPPTPTQTATARPSPTPSPSPWPTPSTTMTIAPAAAATETPPATHTATPTATQPVPSPTPTSGAPRTPTVTATPAATATATPTFVAPTVTAVPPPPPTARPVPPTATAVPPTATPVPPTNTPVPPTPTPRR